MAIGAEAVGGKRRRSSQSTDMISALDDERNARRPSRPLEAVRGWKLQYHMSMTIRPGMGSIGLGSGWRSCSFALAVTCGCTCTRDQWRSRTQLLAPYIPSLRILKAILKGGPGHAALVSHDRAHACPECTRKRPRLPKRTNSGIVFSAKSPRVAISVMRFTCCLLDVTGWRHDLDCQVGFLRGRQLTHSDMP